jgi:hypothetical protein
MLRSIYNDVKFGRIENVRIAIDSGFDPRRNDFDIGNTLLHIATHFRQEDIVRFLLNEIHIVDDVVNDHGNTALMLASSKFNANIFTMLISDINMDRPNFMGMTPLLQSYRSKKYNYSIHLLRLGANYSQRSVSGYRISEEFVNANLNPRRPIARRAPTRRTPTRRNIATRNRTLSGAQRVPTAQYYLSERSLTAIQATLDEATRYNSELHRSILSDADIEQRVQQTMYRSASSSLPPLEPREAPKMNELPVPAQHMMNEYKDMLVETKKSCPICFVEYDNKDKIVITKCFHLSCSDCYIQIRNDKCHICRENLT